MIISNELTNFIIIIVLCVPNFTANYKFNFPTCIILGNEVTGVSEEVANYVSEHIEISMKGVKQSFNVSVAAGIVCFEMMRQYLIR